LVAFTRLLPWEDGVVVAVPRRSRASTHLLPLVGFRQARVSVLDRPALDPGATIRSPSLPDPEAHQVHPARTIVKLRLKIHDRRPSVQAATRSSAPRHSRLLLLNSRSNRANICNNCSSSNSRHLRPEDHRHLLSRNPQSRRSRLLQPLWLPMRLRRLQPSLPRLFPPVPRAAPGPPRSCPLCPYPQR